MARWPQIPASVQGVGGPIRVRMVKRETGDHGELAWGTWEMATRTIRIERGAKPAQRWRVFYHELHHSALDDSGLSELITDAMEEAFCQAVASARMVERFGTNWKCRV